MLPALLAGLWVQPSRRRPAALLGILAEAAAHVAVVGAPCVILYPQRRGTCCVCVWYAHTHTCMHVPVPVPVPVPVHAPVHVHVHVHVHVQVHVSMS